MTVMNDFSMSRRDDKLAMKLDLCPTLVSI